MQADQAWKTSLTRGSAIERSKPSKFTATATSASRPVPPCAVSRCWAPPRQPPAGSGLPRNSVGDPWADLPSGPRPLPSTVSTSGSIEGAPEGLVPAAGSGEWYPLTATSAGSTGSYRWVVWVSAAVADPGARV